MSSKNMKILLITWGEHCTYYHDNGCSTLEARTVRVEAENSCRIAPSSSVSQADRETGNGSHDSRLFRKRMGTTCLRLQRQTLEGECVYGRRREQGQAAAAAGERKGAREGSGMRMGSGWGGRYCDCSAIGVRVPLLPTK